MSQLNMESVYFLGTLFSFFVVLGLYLFQTRKGNVAKVSQQEKLAKAARDVTKERLEDAIGVLKGKKVGDNSSFRILYRKLFQYKHDQWRKHEYDLKDSITSAAIMYDSHMRPEAVVEEIAVIFERLHGARGYLGSLFPIERARVRVFLENWLQTLETAEQ